MGKNEAQLKIRLPAELKEDVSALAKKNKRSINAEIVNCLENTSRKRDKARISSHCAVEELVNLVTEKAVDMVDRELALKSLTPKEKKLLIVLEKLPKNKRETILASFISIADLF